MTLTFSKPVLPDSILVFSGDQTTSIQPSSNETVAVIGTHTWGPVGLAGLTTPPRDPVYGSLQQYEQDFGTDTSPLRDGVLGAFVGMGLDGEMGAGGVIPYRIAASATAAFRTIQNSSSQAALTLTAIYQGTAGNNISYIIDDDPIDATRDRLRVLVSGQQRESYSYLASDITGLAAMITARSRWVVPSAVTSGTALTPTAGTSLTGGADGATVTSTDYDNAMRMLEFLGFRVLCLPGLTSAPVKTQIAGWVASMRDEMRPVQVVLGGAAGEDVSTALSELTSNPTLREEHVVRLAVGTWQDDYLKRQVGTSSLVGRVAGAMCARGLKGSLTRARFAGLHPIGSAVPTIDDLQVGRDNGLTMFRRISAPDADLAISQGVSTFISTTTTGKPYELFSEPRIVGVLDYCIRYMSDWGNLTVTGKLPVTDDTRALVRKEGRKLLDQLEASGLADPGSGFIVVDPPTDPSLRDAIPYQIGFVPSRTANYLIGVGRVQ